MQTKVIYLKGDASDEERLGSIRGFRLQSVVHCQGQIVGYMVREPWAAPAEEKPLETRAPIKPTPEPTKGAHFGDRGKRR